MKSKTIKAMARRVGQTRAEKFWALFVERLCDGIEPEDGDTFRREDIEKRFENNPVARDAFIAVLCGEQKPETPKPTALKEKHRETLDTAVLFAEYLKGGCPAWITAELIDRSKGQACLFLRDDNKPYDAESVKWIDWIRSGTPLADGMKIDGKYRKPVRIGDEKPAQTLPIDPFPVGMRGIAPLTMPDYQSRCGASLAIKNDKGETVCVAGDVLSFLRLVAKYESPSQREQRDACEMAKVGGMEALKKTWPKASDAWDVGERPEASVPFAEPTAVTTAPRGGVVRPKGWIPTLCFLGTVADREAWHSLYTHLAPLEAVGVFRITSDSQVKPGDRPKDVVAGYLARADAVMCIVTPTAHTSDAREQTLQFDGPKVPVLLGMIAGYEYTWGDLQPLPASGKAARSSDERAALAMEIAAYAAKLQPRTQRPVFDHDRVHKAILSAGLAEQRAALLDGIDREFTASLVTNTLPAAQVSLDLSGLKGVCLIDGGRPMLTYLANALRLAGDRAEESAVLREAIAALT